MFKKIDVLNWNQKISFHSKPPDFFLKTSGEISFYSKSPDFALKLLVEFIFYQNLWTLL